MALDQISGSVPPRSALPQMNDRGKSFYVSAPHFPQLLEITKQRSLASGGWKENVVGGIVQQKAGRWDKVQVRPRELRFQWSENRRNRC